MNAQMGITAHTLEQYSLEGIYNVALIHTARTESLYLWKPGLLREEGVNVGLAVSEIEM